MKNIKPGKWRTRNGHEPCEMRSGRASLRRHQRPNPGSLSPAGLCGIVEWPSEAFGPFGGDHVRAVPARQAPGSLHCDCGTSSNWPYPVSYKILSCFSETTEQNSTKHTHRRKCCKLRPEPKFLPLPPRHTRAHTHTEPKDRASARPYMQARVQVCCPGRPGAETLDPGDSFER